MLDASMVVALLGGVAVAAATGLRAFLPLAVIGFAGRAGWIALQPGTEWLAGDFALWALGTATALEILADKVPALDHALDALGVVLRPAAAWLAAYALLQGWPTPWAQLAALALAAGALGVHLVKAQLRLGGNLASGGLAAPALSAFEDVAAAVAAVAAVLAPAVAVGLIAAAVLAWRRRRRARG